MTRLGEYLTKANDGDTKENVSSSIQEPKQIVFEVENLPKMVLKFKDLMSCLACEQSVANDYDDDTCSLSSEISRTSSGNKRRGSLSRSKEYDEFMSRLKESKLSATNDDRLSIHINEAMKNVSKSVSCISCRTAVERLAKQIMPSSSDKDSLALDPIRLNGAGMISLKPSLLDPDALYSLLYIDRLEDELNQLVNSKRQVNKRCQLHSTDIQKTTRQKWVDEWTELWDAIESDEVRKKLLVIDSVELLDALNKYLKRNQFCSDCKLKILIAFKSLTKEAVLEIEKTTYKTEIFSGIECCFNENDSKEPAHLHVRNDKEFIADLIVKAIPEIQGERSERHAKSFEMAQEEVLVCIGLFLYERFFSVYQAMRIQEQAWRILFYTCLNTLVKKIQLEIGKKSNELDLDQICAELEAIDESKKSQKQKTNKNNKTPKQQPQKQRNVKSISTQKSQEENKTEKVINSESTPSNKHHTCYNGDQPAKITTVLGNTNSNSNSNPPSQRKVAKSKCNKSKKTQPISMRQTESANACECDDESQFVHDHADERRRVRCEMSCCFDIIEYWNRLVREDDEKAKTKKIVPRRLKLNYVDFEEVDSEEMITEEEKREYFENRARYLALRMARRQQLIDDWKLLSTTSLKLISINN